MKNTTKILSVIVLLAASACGQVTVRYIANEGVLIASGNKQILIDGLHREYKSDYLFPPPEMKALLENARAPYDKINVLLVSHIHLDHFHPESIWLYLKNNPKSVFASSGQAVDEVTKGFADHEKIRPQIKPVTHEWKKSVDMTLDGVKIKFLGLHHSGERFKEIQNFGHLIEIGGKKLLHIGDADMTAENFSAFGLLKEKIDIAFIPYWFLTSPEGRTFVKDQFNPKQIIAVHIPPAQADEVIKQLKKDLPEAIAFTKILEEKNF